MYHRRVTVAYVMRRRTALLFAFALLVFLAARPAGAQEATGAASIEWEPCGGGWDCGYLEVPLDYSEPEGATIEIAVVRQPARSDAERIGVLLMNPGGPGGEAINFTRTWARILGTSITERFDIVGFDPRGVGRSSPIICHDTLLDYVGADPAPRNQEDFDALIELSEQFAQDCMARHGDLIPHLGTRNVARDMDRIREALGEEQLNYVGYSYGTRIGSVYADLFPEQVRAFVLDGAVDNSLSPMERALAQAEGFERALRNFIAHCEQNDCALAGDDIYRQFRMVWEQSRSEPIPAAGADRDARPGDVFYGMIMPLYNRLTWGMLEDAVADALEGDGSLLVHMANRYLSRDSDGEFSNQTEANIAINCADRNPEHPAIDSWEEYRAALPQFREASELFGPAMMVSSCIGWPVGTDPAGVPTAEGAAPILVIGTTGDPATPYEWAEAMAEQLDSGVLLRHEGEGHTVYALGGSRCVNTVVNSYLIGLTAPESGTMCSGSDDPVPPEQLEPGATPEPAPGAAQGTGGDGVSPWAIVVIAVVAVMAGGVAATAVVLWRRA